MKIQPFVKTEDDKQKKYIYIIKNISFSNKTGRQKPLLIESARVEGPDQEEEKEQNARMELK